MTLNRMFDVIKMKERPAGYVPEDTPFKKEIEVKSDFTFSEDEDPGLDAEEMMQKIPKEYFVKFTIDPEK